MSRMDFSIAPDPTTAGTWVLDDIFHFMGGSDVDHRNLEAVRRANDEAKMKAARRPLQACTEM